MAARRLALRRVGMCSSLQDVLPARASAIRLHDAAVLQIALVAPLVPMHHVRGQTLVGWAGTARAREARALQRIPSWPRIAQPTQGVGEGMTGPSFPERQPVGEFIDPWGPVVDRLRAATIGEYDIGYELGRGGMAAVFLAYDLALARHVAIKVMSPALLMGEGMVERFRQEARTIANLTHPGIITIYAVRQLADLHFFVMRFIEGRSLEHILSVSPGGLPISVVRSLLQQVGGALGYAHRKGVVHRDVKPANILVDVEGTALVTDFGIAKVAASSTHTQTGIVVGTPAYISPEQCMGKPVDGHSDQYSLGVAAYEMLTGKPPFAGQGFAIMLAHASETPRPINELRPDCPPELEAAVLRMLAKNPVDRFDTMGDALDAIGDISTAEDEAAREHLATLAKPDETLHRRLSGP